jgi:C_GCAxxG_C_C family probable redox protein
MLKERAKKYYNENYNCAETILHAANDEYQLGLDNETIRLTAGFGGGMGCGQACGALCGGICAISAAIVEDRAHQTPELRGKTTKLVAAFNRILGDTQCKNLMPKYKTPETRCLQTVLLACDALSEVMEEK